MHSEIQLGLIRQVAAARQLDTVVLRDPRSLSWLTGARWHVQHDLHATSFDLVVAGLGLGSPWVQVVTNVIEGPRLRQTELLAQASEWEFVEVPWDSPREAVLPSGARVGSDRPLADTQDIAADIARARRVLTPDQRAGLESLVADAATAVSQQLHLVSGGEREWDVAAAVTAALISRGMEPVVCLVGSGDRLATVKHPLPTGRRVEGRLMVSVSARRHGLVAAITRYAVVGKPGAGELDEYRRLLDVEAGFLRATRPGRPLREVFADGIAGYATHGFGADEWTRHHQGGLTGFAPRDVLASRHTDDALLAGEAVAWNPTAAGWKVESTSLVTTDGAVPLDGCLGWPTSTVDGRVRPAVLSL